jgi:signal peptidase I
VAGSRDRIERARREALRFARDARRLARWHRRALGERRKELEAAATAVEQAAAEGEPERLSGALQALNGLWDEHLAPRQRPLWRQLLEAAVLAAILALLVRGLVVDTCRVRSGSMEPTLLPGDVLLVHRTAYGLRLPFLHRHLLDLGAPRRGDVIVFEGPHDPGNAYVKRVVGVPGDVIELREQVLLVNGVPQPRTAAGEYAVAEEGRAGGGDTASICRRYHEALAKGVLTVPEEGDEVSGQVRWESAAAEGVATYDVLQCRRVRLASREGPFEVVAPGSVFVLGDNRDLSADSRGLGGWQVPLGEVRGRVTRVLWSWGEGGWSPHGAVGLRLDRLFKGVASR